MDLSYSPNKEVESQNKKTMETSNTYSKGGMKNVSGARPSGSRDSACQPIEIMRKDDQDLEDIYDGLKEKRYHQEPNITVDTTEHDISEIISGNLSTSQDRSSVIQKSVISGGHISRSTNKSTGRLARQEEKVEHRTSRRERSASSFGSGQGVGQERFKNSTR